MTKAEMKEFFRGGGKFRRIEKMGESKPSDGGAKAPLLDITAREVEVIPYSTYFEWRGENAETGEEEHGRGYYSDVLDVERLSESKLFFRYRWGGYIYERIG